MIKELNIKIKKCEGKFYLELDSLLGTNHIKAYSINDTIILVKDKQKLDEEQAILLKIKKLPFGKRTKKEIEKLPKKEKEIIEQLIEKGLLRWYRGKGYKYEILLEPKKREEKDYFIFDNEKDALEFSKSIASEANNYIGVRGFDGKYYVAKVDFYNKKKDEVLDVLTEELKDEEIARRSGLTLEECSVLLNILREKGEILEIRKNIYKRDV